jgi:DNA repair and recombination RAD54-like protein
VIACVCLQSRRVESLIALACLPLSFHRFLFGGKGLFKLQQPLEALIDTSLSRWEQRKFRYVLPVISAASNAAFRSPLVATPLAGKDKTLGKRTPTPSSIDRLHKPFKCPGVAGRSPAVDRPSRKRRKVDYGGADGEADNDKPYSNDDRLALATRDINRFLFSKLKIKVLFFARPSLCH